MNVLINTKSFKTRTCDCSVKPVLVEDRGHREHEREDRRQHPHQPKGAPDARLPQVEFLSKLPGIVAGVTGLEFQEALHFRNHLFVPSPSDGFG